MQMFKISKSLLLKIAVAAPALFAFICICLPYIYFYKARRALLKFKTVPYQNPILGHVGIIPSNNVDAVEWALSEMKNHRDQGGFPIIFGFLPTFLVYDPRIFSELIGGQRHAVKNLSYEFLVPWLGRGVLIANGEKWKQRRRLTTPAFHFEVLKKFVEVMNEQSDVLAQKLEEDMEKPLDFFEYVTTCALDIICETAMGKKIDAQRSSDENPYIQAVYEMSKLAYERSIYPWLMFDFIYYFTEPGRRHGRALKILHEFTLSVIAERRKLHQENQVIISKKPAFLDLLLTSNVNGTPLTDEDIREEVDTFMFEGHDTTSASLAWTIYLLGHHPEIQEKLRLEIQQVVGEESFVSIEIMGQLKYLEMVLKESLRLYPSVPIVGRYTTEDIVYQGVTIPKGTSISLAILGLHRNPLYWENPEEFIPERWENGDIEKRNPYLYVPFSAGPRNCVGQNFAKYEEKVILTKMIQKFRFTSLEKVRISPEVISRPFGGVKVKVEKVQ